MMLLGQLGTKNIVSLTSRLDASHKKTPPEFCIPSDVERWHDEYDGKEIDIGGVTFLKRELADASRCFGVAFTSATTVRWYTWNRCDRRVWYSDDERETWTTAGQPFEVFVQELLQEQRKQAAQDEMRYREKCVHGRYVPSPELCRVPD